MPTCPECGTHFRVPPDECADHPCPTCGYYPYEDEDEEGDEVVVHFEEDRS